MDMVDCAWLAYLEGLDRKGRRLSREQRYELVVLRRARFERERIVADLEPIWSVLDGQQSLWDE